MSPDGFFDRRREWSRWKHRLLERYLGKFAGILGSRYSTIFFVDGFAGAGRYTSPSEDGSPVIAARLAAQPSANHRPYTLRCVNVEPESFDELVLATSEFPSRLVENKRGTFREHLDGILAAVGPSPALFFLDPYGHKGMEWDVISRIAGRSRAGLKTEVLVNLAAPKIDRDGGWVDSTKRAAPAFVNRLDALFGTADWRDLYRRHRVQRDRIEALTSLYMGRLAEAFDGAAARFAVRSIDGRLKYFIIHGTHSQSGVRAMSDAVFRVSEEYRIEQAAVRASSVQPSLFPELEQSEESGDTRITEELASEIRGLRSQHSQPTFLEIQDALLARWFGRAVEKHFRAACKLLVSRGDAVLIPPSGEEARHRGGIGDRTRVRFVFPVPIDSPTPGA